MDLLEGVGIKSSDEREFSRLKDPTSNTDELLWCLAVAQHDFGQAAAKTAVRVEARHPHIIKREVS